MQAPQGTAATDFSYGVREAGPGQDSLTLPAMPCWKKRHYPGLQDRCMVRKVDKSGRVPPQQAGPRPDISTAVDVLWLISSGRSSHHYLSSRPRDRSST